MSNSLNPNCTACVCHQFANHICMAGTRTEGEKKLMIFTDYPDFFADRTGKPYTQDTGALIDWLLARMSVNPEDVALDYTLRCYAKEAKLTTKAGRAEAIEECARYRFASITKCKPRSIVALGQASMEAFTGKTKIADHEGCEERAWESVVAEFSPSVWVSYSIAYLLISPSDTPRVFRTIFASAKQAGLHPKINPKVPPFRWRNIM